MKKSFLNKIGALAMAATMIVVAAMPAFAAGTNYSTTIGGTKTTTFDKYLVMDKEANVPNTSFTYAVSPGAAQSYDISGRQFEVLAGVEANKVTITGTSANTIAFTPADSASSAANSMIKNFDTATKKAAIKSATVDFSAVVFPEPGVYRYIITESGSNQAVTNDEDLTRVIDVYVMDANGASGKTLEVTGYVLHSNANDAPTVPMSDDNGTKGGNDGGVYDPGSTKSQGFTNDYDTSNIAVKTEVTGNQASKDKYFEFTVNITDCIPGTVLDVDLTNADATSGSNAATIPANSGKTNPAKITVGPDGTATVKYYLQHGQNINILGVPKDTKYVVTEVPEDYKATESAVAEYTDPVRGTLESVDIKTSYLNTRAGVIPTGVVLAIAPFAAITLLGGLGAASISMKKRKEEE